MKIAIHHRQGSFSDHWIDYCKRNHIDYKIVNAYSNDIIEQVNDCDAFMWHHHHANPKDVLFAKQLLYSLEESGKRVFPDSHTTWHFDDKVGQKYLLESIGAPLVPSYVFYEKSTALDWIKQTTFPKVFKLRGGAGAVNVRLVHTAKKARKLIKRAFGNGFPQHYTLKKVWSENIRKHREGKMSLNAVVKSLAAFILKPSDYHKLSNPEKGYIYIQDFIPNNSYDIRVCIVGKKAFALKRLTRQGDFRASGSGNIIYDKNQIDERCVSIAFNTNKKLKCQSIAFDFVFDKDNHPLIVEISYGYAVKAYDYCEGYWTSDMQWHEGDHFDFCGWMVNNLINKG